MGREFTRRSVLGALAASAAGPVLAGAPDVSIRPRGRGVLPPLPTVPSVEEIIGGAKLGGDIGFVVADARTGDILETHRPLARMPPASVAKAVTALYGLETLGPGYRFRTRLIATGPINDGRLEGDLILVGGGDPTLDTDALGDMAAELKAVGLREVTGAFRVNSQALPNLSQIDPGQPPHHGYNPAVSGLNLNYNRVHFEWKRNGKGYDLTMDARARRFSPRVRSARMTIVDRKVPVFTYSAENEIDTWTVARRALGSSGSRWLPVRRPDRYCAEVFQTLARSHGIVLKDAVPAAETVRGAVLVERSSPPLRDIVQSMLKWSTNLTAEAIGLSASAARGVPPTDLAGSASAMNDWARDRLGMRTPAFVDHSGLGEASRVSAADMARALVAIGPDDPFRSLLKPFDVEPVPTRTSQAEAVNVRAKTGTLYFVSALAGFVTAPSGRELAFAIFTGDVERRAALAPSDSRPAGARSWTARSKGLQRSLIRRWAMLQSG